MLNFLIYHQFIIIDIIETRQNLCDGALDPRLDDPSMAHSTHGQQDRQP